MLFNLTCFSSYYKDSQIYAVGLWPAYSFGDDTCPILRRKINVLWSSGLFVMNSNGKSVYLSIYFQSVWFPAVYHLSTRCTTRPNFSPYPETVLPMVGQRMLYEDTGGRLASTAARRGGAFCPYTSTKSMICDEGQIKQLPPWSTHQLPYSLPRLLN